MIGGEPQKTIPGLDLVDDGTGMPTMQSLFAVCAWLLSTPGLPPSAAEAARDIRSQVDEARSILTTAAVWARDAMNEHAPAPPPKPTSAVVLDLINKLRAPKDGGGQ